MKKKIPNTLSPEEERIILHKGTEAPFSGKYDNFYEKGAYHCKGGNACFTRRRINLSPAADGRALMMRSKER